MTSAFQEKSDRAEKRELRRQCIVDTAARLFAELGFSHCEMERLAAELQIAKGTLYLYFPGKEDLFLACVDRGMSQMQQAVGTAAAKCEEPLARISAGIRAYL
ncbi:MAG: helix-turn-helix domain-containing protein, partial [Planctomycetales bacterium]